jgi:protein dithiol oxidoreductase (disulfide-forming)
MNRPFALLGLMVISISACGREPAPAEKAAATAAPPEAIEQAPAAPAPAAPTTPQSETEQATAAQETGEAADDPGDASLERLAQLPASQSLPTGRWKPGTNYDPIVPAQPTSVGSGKVEVLEIFWLGCPHCLALEPYLASWQKNKPEYIQFVRIPVMWGPAHRAHARLFYTLEAMNRQDLVTKAFETIHNGQMLLGRDEASTLEAQTSWAKSNGADEKAFRQAYGSFTVSSNMSRAEDLTKRYRVEGVPYVVINGKYGTDVGKAGGPSNLISLINDLAASERPR